MVFFVVTGGIMEAAIVFLMVGSVGCRHCAVDDIHFGTSTVFAMGIGLHDDQTAPGARVDGCASE